MFGLASDERLRQLLDTAGFTDMRLEDVPVVLAPRSIADYIATARDTGGAFARAYDEASAEARNTITREIAEAFAPFEVDGGYELPGVALAAVAR